MQVDDSLEACAIAQLLGEMPTRVTRDRRAGLTATETFRMAVVDGAQIAHGDRAIADRLVLQSRMFSICPLWSVQSRAR